MYRYVLEFSKTGTICYTSHLDIMRFFRRTFKRAGIKLIYSQGFNPHPKMGFAQPLALGYEGRREYIEFETVEEQEPETLKAVMESMMPEGIDIKDCAVMKNVKKSLAAETEAAHYTVMIPLHKSFGSEFEECKRNYNGQREIIVFKKQKKKKELKEVDIRPMIRQIDFDIKECSEAEQGKFLEIRMLLDQGSVSNLSPELVIDSVLKSFGISTDRSEIKVIRDEIIFSDKVDI